MFAKAVLSRSIAPSATSVMVIRLCTLGTVELHSAAGESLDALVAQPKRLGLLAYLALARPLGFHRRDQLLAMFWPEQDESHARDSLNQAIRFLRQSLGSGVVLSRGAEEVGLDRAQLWCDAFEFQAAIEQEKPREAIELYRGELLSGFFVAGSHEFDEWLEAERVRLREQASFAARCVAEAEEAAGRLTQALRWGRLAVGLSKDDERALRRWLTMLARAGDRAGAIQAYEDFARRLRDEFEADPSSETQDLVETIRRESRRPLADAASLIAAPISQRQDPSVPETPPFSPGGILAHGSYVITREIGVGGMATVYMARDFRHDRWVVVKVLRAEVALAVGVEGFLREIRIAAALQHPHVVPVFDSGAADGRLYFVMPLIEGESLRARLDREGALPLGDALRIAREVADAVAYAHKHGVVHRDIKPENILLTGEAGAADSHAMVADFGIARAIETSGAEKHLTVTEATGHHVLTSVGVALGTPTYMAPEQAAGEAGVDHRADLYALGVMTYEMLAGKPPYTGSTAQSVLAAHLTQPPAPIADHRPEVTAPLASLVMRCLEKSPSDRWQTAAELLTELERVTSGGLARSQPAAASTKQSSQRLLRRPRVWVVVAGSLTIIAAGAYAVRSRGSSPAVHPTGPPRVAVLPFENLGAAVDEYFADGMTEELTGRLAKLSGLSVKARTSVMQYKKTTKSITQIASELGADFLIEGMVRWEKTPDGGGRVRVTSKIIRASDGTHVWGDEFDKPYGADIFAIQSDIAEHVARALDVTVRPADVRTVRGVPTNNLAAYDAYIRAQTYLDRDLDQNWKAERDAVESLEQAIRLDPGFAAAHALLATLYLTMVRSGYDESLPTGIAKDQRFEMAGAEALRAVALDSTSAPAHRVLASYYGAAGDTARARTEVILALRGEPSSADAITDRARALFAAGRADDGIREFERAAMLDPRNPRRWMNLATFHRVRRDFPSARGALDRGIAVAPSEPTLYAELAWQLLMAGRRDEARATLRNAIAQAGEAAMLYRIAQASAWRSMIHILPEELAGPAARATWAQFGADTIDYYSAKIRAYWSDPGRARTYFDSLLTWHQRQARTLQDPGLLAWGLAGLGRRVAAERQLERVLPSDYPTNENGRELAAETCVMIGNYDCAVQQLALMLDNARVWTLAIIRLDPTFAPLQNRADFKKLAEIQ